MKTKLLAILCLAIIPLVGRGEDKKTICISKGTTISISLAETITSKRIKHVPHAYITTDVWDNNGKLLLIKQGTPVTLQIQATTSSLWGDAASLMGSLR